MFYSECTLLGGRMDIEFLMLCTEFSLAICVAHIVTPSTVIPASASLSFFCQDFTSFNSLLLYPTPS